MNPTPEQIAQALPHVLYEIESLFLGPKYNVANKELAESVEFRRMAHGRALYTFFTKAKRTQEKDDDVLCGDFGFPSTKYFYNTENEKNKSCVIGLTKTCFTLRTTG